MIISDRPRLSVVVPCHDVAGYLGDTLRSLALSARSVPPGASRSRSWLDLVLVDDASTDDTPALLAEAERTIPGVRVITSAHNVGLAAARNLGVEQATGEYLTFLDGDDYVAPGHLAALVAAIGGLDCDFVRVDHVQFTGPNRTLHRVPFGPRRRRLDPRSGILPDHRMTAVDYPYAWAGVYHRRLAEQGLLRFDPELRTCEDRPWIWRLHLRARSCAVVGLHGLFYRRNVTTSLSRITDRRQLDFLPAFDRIVAEVQADRDAELLLGKVLRSYCAIVHHHLTRPEYAPAMRQLIRERSATAMARLPRRPLRRVVETLEPERRSMIDALLRAA